MSYTKKDMKEIISKPNGLVSLVKSILSTTDSTKICMDARSDESRIEHNRSIIELFADDYFPNHKVIVHSFDDSVRTYIMPLEWYRKRVDYIEKHALLNSPEIFNRRQIKFNLYYKENTINIISGIIKCIYNS